MSDDAVEVVIEIPKGSRNKYEFDPERHVMRLGRRLFSATAYPADHGRQPCPPQPAVAAGQHRC